ncbi:MAG: alpha/beta hydrolase [Acidimicrobiia bacterium]|nr:alpha/beta hydrolase [Acidimicrobiia bacterium]
MELWDDAMEAARPKLREETAAFLSSLPFRAADLDALPVEDWVARQRIDQLGGPPSDRASDRTIAGPAGTIRLRTFVPDDVAGVMLHIHGGGWVAGSPEMTDLLHEILMDTCKIAVVSVDYRLAPEHPYPAAPDDCEAAARWLLEHAAAEFGSDRLLIGGESAGAHLAAVTLVRMKEKFAAAGRFLGANLVFGAYDLSQTPSQRGVGLEPGNDMLEALEGPRSPLDLFLPGLSLDARRDPDVSPLYADLRGMPPALFSVGTYDHLLDDTLFMASRWRAAGNRTELLVYPDAPHACIALPTVATHFFPRLLTFLDGCLEVSGRAQGTNAFLADAKT